MGVLFDYFRAPDAGAAIRALERDGGPNGRGGPGQPVFDALDAKGIDHAVMLTQLVDIIRGESTDFTTVTALDFVSVWPSSTPPTGDEWTTLPEGSPWREGPWIDELGQRTLDGLADADDARLPEISARWGREAGLDGDLAELVAEFVALARRARDAGDRLYCWSCL
ncbi:hypothetical protein [Streptodolium elevatio]|uniref:DUF1877 family protein n=1 Tax=Streptodolium elevatio TaxID=3157996 RepID=A0ABV3DML4_9ACTN